MVTAIFMVLSTIVLSSNARFGSVVVLKNLAHDMALSIRQAQVYSIAVLRYEAAGDEFEVGYGMHFSPFVEGSPTTYQLFADANNNGRYDDGDTNVQETTIGGGYHIVEMTIRETETGVEAPTNEPIDIVFRRPEPDACINGAFDADNDCVSSFDRATIVIESNSGDRAEVVVESSGQISVN